MAPSLFKVLRVIRPLVEDHIVSTIVAKYGANVLELRLDVTFYPKELEEEGENNDDESDDDSRSEDEENEKEVDAELDSGPKWYCKTLPHQSGHAKKPTYPSCRISSSSKTYRAAQPSPFTPTAKRTNGEKDFKSKADWDDNEFANSIYFCGKAENWEEIKAKEQKYPWRRLKKLTLHTYGGNHDFGWLANTAKNLEYFEIKAHNEGFLGAPGSMPALRFLHVDGIAVTSVLNSFLQGVHGTLSKIRNTECVALAEDIHDDKQPTWEDLWKVVRQAIKAPAEVVFVPTRKRPITQEEYYHREDDLYKPPSDEEEKIKKFRRMAKEEDGFCIWPYVWVDSQYGYALPEWEMDVARLESGEDNLEFKLLMEEVQRGGGRCVS
ncbi:uncharacterized protein B0J16DRAFT_353471 [Fusarium flagelliforme]|uniref:uncharacterized protein n=1 Tax=Fusarium flagelliforme TaxID=2675880 RepID=UPI001E8EAABC|nr:uncharacterized protein B0J16DRAFT_353471 [Fusarium flagelliforme]KAH7191812.1 hypothetical protein B0J16DRAFT_353471 [Fusarium flagelliforme]